MNAIAVFVVNTNSQLILHHFYFLHTLVLSYE